MKWSYPFKHWGLTLILGAVIFCTVQFFPFNSFKAFMDWLQLLLAAIALTFILSLPTLFGYLLVFYTLEKTRVNIQVAKILLIVVSVLGICITLQFLDGEVTYELALPFSVAAICVGLFLRLSNADRETGKSSSILNGNRSVE